VKRRDRRERDQRRGCEQAECWRKQDGKASGKPKNEQNEFARWTGRPPGPTRQCGQEKARADAGRIAEHHFAAVPGERSIALAAHQIHAGEKIRQQHANAGRRIEAREQEERGKGRERRWFGKRGLQWLLQRRSICSFPVDEGRTMRGFFARKAAAGTLSHTASLVLPP
jgi:hypothetical protein